MGMKRRHLGPKFSEGARLLWAVLGRLNSQEAVRERIDCSQGLVNRWLYGDRLPGLSYVFKLEDAFGIPCRAWMLKPAKRFSLPTYPRT